MRWRLTGFWCLRGAMATAASLVMLMGSLAVASARSTAPERVTVWQAAMAGSQFEKPYDPKSKQTRSPNRTVRQLFKLSSESRSIRVRFSNYFGKTPLTIQQAWAGNPVASSTARLVSGSNVRMTFGGRGSVKIPPGEQAWSDAVDIRVQAGDQVALSVYAPGSPVSGKNNIFPYAYDVAGMYISTPGNHARDSGAGAFPALKVISDPKTYQAAAYYPGQVWWTDVVAARTNSIGTVVAVGDSITDGFNAIGPPGQRWTDVLATRLNALPAARRLSVSNAAISGNTVSDQPNPYEPKPPFCCGLPAVKRLWRDALSVPGVAAIILLEGTNDIGGSLPGKWGDVPPSPPEQVKAAMRDIVKRAHARSISVIGATLIPMGMPLKSVQEKYRQAVNAWIRGSGVFDEVIDFDAMVRDPKAPWQIYEAWRAPAWAGRYYHPNAMGHTVMGQGIDLKVFKAVRPAGVTG
ncbi:MAG: GDSL-type esterase/lipase family protein [Actinomycetota bacterium]